MQAERSEKEELTAEYALKNAEEDSMCSQLRDLYAPISFLKKRLEELGVSSEISKPKTELMVYTLLHKRSGSIEVDFERGVVFTSDFVNGVVLPELQSAARVEMLEETILIVLTTTPSIPKNVILKLQNAKISSVLVQQ